MRIVVTGGAGFIGSHLVDHLVDQAVEVLVIDNCSSGEIDNLKSALTTPLCALEICDIRSVEAGRIIELFAPDIVFHLAAQADVRISVEDPLFDAEVNVVGSLNVFSSALRGGVRRIIAAASGGTLYGDVAEELIPTPETAPWQPSSPYGISKRMMIDYLRFYHEAAHVETAALALSNVYGPRQNPHGEAGVVAIFSNLLLAGLAPNIYGTGEQTRDFVYVDDVVEAFLRAGFRPSLSHAVCNIGTGRQTTVNELFDALQMQANTDLIPHYAPARPGELDRSALDVSRAAELLNWRPLFTFKEGLAHTYAALGDQTI